MDEHGLRQPVLANVYVLSGKAAEKMSKGEPPGCWVSPELLERIRSEAKEADAGRAARLERAARMVAVIRGLRYAGAYLGGDHQAEHVRWIIKRSETLASRWEELEEEFSFVPKNAFYFFDTRKSEPKTPGFVPQLLDFMTKTFPVSKEGRLRSLLVGLFRMVDKRAILSKSVERFEFVIKSPLFGCQACGNCVLSYMEYICPQTCPKNMRNGPCGGTKNGQCEVVDRPCIWVEVYERAKATNRINDLQTFVPPPRRDLQGTSSWVNYFLGRDSRPDNNSLTMVPLAALMQYETQGEEVSSQGPKKLSVPQPKAPVVKNQR